MVFTWIIRVGRVNDYVKLGEIIFQNLFILSCTWLKERCRVGFHTQLPNCHSTWDGDGYPVSPHDP